MTTMTRSGTTNLRLPAIILVVGLILMGIKFVAWWLTNSNAILSDALESIINIVAGTFSLFSLYLAGRPRDENHPYGHGKVEFISAGFEGSLIAIAGFSIIGKAGYNLLHPQELAQLDLGLLLTGVTGVVNYGMGALLIRKGTHDHSLTQVASGKHLQSDAWSSAGLVFGLGLVYWTGINLLDSVLAIIFAFIIIYTGYQLVRQSVAGIMDEADSELLRELIPFLHQNRSPHWIDIHNLRVIKYGALLHIDCHLTLPWYFQLPQAHDEVKAVEQLAASFRKVPVELFIHVDPCLPSSCRICSISDCQVRQHPQETTVPWVLDNVMQNQKHR